LTTFTRDARLQAEGEIKELTSLVSRIELEKMTLSGRVRELESHEINDLRSSTSPQHVPTSAGGARVELKSMKPTPAPAPAPAPAVLSPLPSAADLAYAASSPVPAKPAVPTKPTLPKPATANAPTGSEVLGEVNKRLTAEHVSQVEGIFQFDVTKPDGSMDHWTLDMLNGSGAVYYGLPRDGATANTTMSMSEETLRRWLSQETDPIAAFMAGELTVEGDQMMTMKLAVLQPIFNEASDAVASGATAAAAPAASPTKPVGSDVFEDVNRLLTAEYVALVGGVFQFDIAKPNGTKDHWTLDMLHGNGTMCVLPTTCCMRC